MVSRIDEQIKETEREQLEVTHDIEMTSAEREL